MLDRVVGFMEPNEFAARLRKLVGQK